MISTNYLAAACLFAASVTLLLALNARRIATWLDLFDRPGGRKHHAQPTPLMGGLVLITVLTPTLLGYMLRYEPVGIGHWALASFAIAMLGCAAIGTIDDHRTIPAGLRFLTTFALFAGLLIVEPRFQLTSLFFTGVDGGYGLGVYGSAVFTLFVLLGFMNAVNMADGKNGLVISLSVIWSAYLAMTGPLGLVSVLVPLSVLLIVLVIFNLRGKLFLGDGGTYGLAALLGLTATYSYNFNMGALKADALMLLFLIPVADMMRLIALRVLERRSPMSSDREHLHHYLLSVAGWPGGLLIYLLLMIVPNAIALWRPELAPALLALSLIVYFAIVAFCRPSRRANRDAAAAAE